MSTDYRAAYSHFRSQAREAAAGASTTGKKPSLLLYFGVAMIALAKDMLDIVLIGSLPGIGTAITLCFAFLIWMLLSLFDRSGANNKQNRQIARSMIQLFVGMLEAVGFGLNFLPMQTLMVGFLYMMARQAWEKQAKEDAQQTSSGQGFSDEANGEAFA